jgi:thioredoxin 2
MNTSLREDLRKKCSNLFAGDTMADDKIIIPCSKCGTKNRIPRNKINDNPICGNCRKPLAEGKIHDRPVDIVDNTFDKDVLGEPGPVLVDCWAPWCGPCRMVAPVLEQLAREYAGRIKIAKLNVDENPVAASKYAVKSIPTMLLFKSGRLVNTLVGALPKNEIEKHMLTIL